MAVTISPYNHTSKLFMDGTNAVSSTFRVKLLTAATFDATHTTLAATGGTEVTNANGYVTNGKALTTVAVTTVNTKDAKFDADDTIWDATGSGISATKAILYNDTATNDPPLWFIDFGETKTASAGDQFKIIWPAAGISTIAVVVA